MTTVIVCKNSAKETAVIESKGEAKAAVVIASTAKQSMVGTAMMHELLRYARNDNNGDKLVLKLLAMTTPLRFKLNNHQK